MPKITYPIPDVYTDVTRPVNMAVIRSIIGVSGIPEDSFIEYSGDQNGIPTWRTTLNQQVFDTTNTARNPFFSKVKVSYVEEPDSDTIYPSSYFYPDNTVNWADKDLNIILSLVREKVKGTLSFTYRTEDKNEAQSWRNDFRRKLKMHFKDESFQSGYSYILPPVLVNMLLEFYRMREAVAPYGDTAVDWFKNNMIADYTVMTTVSGSNPTIEFREIQLDILGNFDFDVPPIEEKLEGGNAYEIQFTFRFGYDRPIGYALSYPLIIHNQIVSTKWRDNTRRYETADQEGNATASTKRYWEIFKRQQLWQKNIGRGFIIPSIDEWYPPNVVQDTTSLVQCLIKVDTNNPTTVIDLQNMGKGKFDPLLIEYMKLVHPFLTLRTGAAVNISVYENERMIDPRDVFVDENLVVHVQQEMDVRKYYHVRVGLFTQLLVLQPDAVKVLRSNPPYLNMILDGLDPNYSKENAYPETINGIWVKKRAYFDAARALSITARKYYSVQYRYILMPTELSYLFQF